MRFKLPEKGPPSSSPLLMAVKILLRTVQLLCSVIILSIYSYFLAALGNHSLPIPDSVRAVEGISGFAILYTVICIVVLCLFPRAAASRPLSSLAVIILDISFAAAFIYVASANGGSSGGCTGNVSTPFGSGDADSGKMDKGGDGFTSLPASLGQACRLQAACLGAAVITIFFFVFSPLAEAALIRHNRHQRRLGNPAPLAPSSTLPGEEEVKKRGWWSRLFGRRAKGATNQGMDENVLPEHAHPEEMRASYATDQTRVDDTHGATATTAYHKYDSLLDPYQTRYQPQQPQGGYHREGLLRHDGTELEEEEDIGLVHGHGGNGNGNAYGNGSMARIGNEARWDEVPLARYPPANYRYSDGVYDRV